MTHYIHYKEGYKYQLYEPYNIKINIRPNEGITTDYIKLDIHRNLTIDKGYVWDGASGVAVDTVNFMRGSLVHDSLYQLMRQGYLDKKEFRKSADMLLRAICREDGMSRIRAWWIYQAVRIGGAFAASSDNKKEILTAPQKCN